MVAPAIVIAVACGQGAVPAGAIALVRFAKDAMSQPPPLFFMPARAHAHQLKAAMAALSRAVAWQLACSANLSSVRLWRSNDRRGRVIAIVRGVTNVVNEVLAVEVLGSLLSF
jgi:hypothetical protein